MKEEKSLTPEEWCEVGRQLIEATLEKYGLTLVVRPMFVARDDGTWSVVVQAEFQAVDSNADGFR